MSLGGCGKGGLVILRTWPLAILETRNCLDQVGNSWDNISMNEKDGGFSLTQGAVGERLRVARERRGLNQGQASAMTKVGVSSLSDFENGKRAPSLDQLSALAAAYDQPLTFFFEDSPTKEVVLWRQRPAEGADEHASRFLKWCRWYRDLEAWCHEETACPVPDQAKAPRNFRDAERLAIDVRGQLDLGDYPAPVLLKVLEEKWGVKVFHQEFEPTGTAASSRDPLFGTSILLNAKSSRRRRNYDLAHELFHLLTWRAFRAESPESSTELEEKLANKFASVLLLPEEKLKAAMGERCVENRLTLSAAIDLARAFDVSVDALVWRVHGMAVKNEAAADEERTRAFIDKAHALSRMGDEASADPPPSRPERFRDLAVRALRNAELSVGRFAEYMGISRQAAMAFVDQEAGGDEAIELSAS
jgi:XRE family transcriptional regulator, fatty acid utilization regulator